MLASVATHTHSDSPYPGAKAPGLMPNRRQNFSTVAALTNSEPLIRWVMWDRSYCFASSGETSRAHTS